MTALRLLDDEILLDGRPVATLLPNLRLSQRDRLIAAFDALDEDAAYIGELEDRIEQLKAQLKEPAR